MGLLHQFPASNSEIPINAKVSKTRAAYTSNPHCGLKQQPKVSLSCIVGLFQGDNRQGRANKQSDANSKIRESTKCVNRLKCYRRGAVGLQSQLSGGACLECICLHRTLDAAASTAKQKSMLTPETISRQKLCNLNPKDSQRRGNPLGFVSKLINMERFMNLHAILARGHANLLCIVPI